MAHDTDKQQGRRDAALTPERDATGRFLSARVQPLEEGDGSFEAFEAKAGRLMDVMLAMSGEKSETFMHSREFPLPICRAIVFKRLYDLGYSTLRIGKFFGKDHATVLHGIKMLGNLLDIHDEETESILSTFDYMIAKPTNNPKTMEKSYYTTVSFEGGLRKVEADLHQTIRQTFEGALVYDAHLPQLVRNFTELVEKRAAELKVKPVPVALSPLFSADMPRFLNIGRIALVLHPIRSVIGVESDKNIN